MAYTDTYNILGGKTISRAYVLKLLQEGYLVKDIARQWAKENKVDIFGGTREKIPAARGTLNTAISRFIFGSASRDYTQKTTGKISTYAGRPPDKELIKLLERNKKNVSPAVVKKQFDKFIKDNKAKYVGKKGGTENLYADAVKWFKKNNPRAITAYGTTEGYAGKGTQLRPGQEVIMIKRGDGATLKSLQRGREEIRKLVAPSKQIRSPLRYDRVKEAWTKAAKSLGMTYNEYQNMLRKNMTYPLKRLFPQLIGTQYAPGPEHMYGLRQAIATGQLSEIRKAAKAVVPAPKAFNSLIKGPKLDLQVTGLLDNAFNTNDLAKRKDIIKTINEKIGKFKSEYPGTYPKYVVNKAGNISDINIKNIAMTKRPLPVQAKEYIDYLIKTPGFKESKEFASLPETSQTLIQSRVDKSPGFYNLVKNLIKEVKGAPTSCQAILRKQTGGIATTCVEAIKRDPVGSANKLANMEATSGALGKVKNAATGFLSLLGRGGARAAPYAAVAAAGALAEPLVKQFRNDDPTTYMTDPDQQKGVLLSLVEAETPKVDEEILNWQYPGIAAGAAAAIPGSAAMYKARRLNIGKPKMGMARAALGPVGKVLAGSFSPLAVAASLPIGIAAQVKGGSDLEDIATDPFNWVGPAFASTGAKMATRGMPKTGILSKALRMGMSPAGLRVLSRGGIYGLLASAGLKGYDIWENSKYK
jgi:hypothetical protein